MAKLFCKGIACAGRAGRWVARASGTEYHRIIFLPASFYRKLKAAAGLSYAGYLGIKPELCSAAVQMPRKCLYNVAGFIRRGKDALTPFHLRGHAVCVYELHYVGIGKAVQRTVQELGIPRYIGKKVIGITAVGYVAASLARKEQLLAQLFVFFKQH